MSNHQYQRGNGNTVRLIVCLTLASAFGPSFAAAANIDERVTGRPAPYEVTGTLSELDLSNGKGLMRTDLGEGIYLGVKKPELFQHLSVGDRLTIQLNEDGQVDKVMGISVPELGISGQPVPIQSIRNEDMP